MSGSKLFSYVETYRLMIEKINKFDRIIEKKCVSKGKTLDMSGGHKQKRSYSFRKGTGGMGFKRQGQEDTKSGAPRHITEFA